MSQHEEHDLKSLISGCVWDCSVMDNCLESWNLRVSGEYHFLSPPVKQLWCCNRRAYYSARGCWSQERRTCHLTSFIKYAKKIQSLYRTTYVRFLTDTRRMYSLWIPHPLSDFSFAFRVEKYQTSHTFPFFVFCFSSLVKMPEFRQFEMCTDIFPLSGLSLAQKFYFVFFGGFFVIFLYKLYEDFLKWCFILCIILPADTERRKSFIFTGQRILISHFFSFVHAICAQVTTVHFFISTNSLWTSV